VIAAGIGGAIVAVGGALIMADGIASGGIPSDNVGC
jgi:hypothetical protein